MWQKLTPSLVGVLCLAIAGLAQTTTTGQIIGTITDPSGAAVTGATITATDASGVQRTATTDQQGHYAFPLLPPGTYRVEAEKTGFSKATLDGMTVRITETINLNVPLTVATQTQSVEVTGEAPMLQTESPARGDVIPSRAVRELPLATRNFQQLLTLTPGTSAAVPNSSDLGRGDTAFNVNGMRTLSNAVVINGVDANSIGTGSTPNLAVPATDSLQEFIVQTNLYDASQGRNAGSVVAAVTRSGTNEFHGNLYEFLRNTDLDANNFFLNRAGVARPQYQRNQFGGTLGGPVVKNRAWFFVSYQGTREVNGTSLVNSIGTVFVPSDLSNDRSAATLNRLAGSYGMPPCTSPFAVLGCLSPTASALLQAKLPNGQYIIPSAPNPIAIPTNGTPAGYVSVPVVGISRFREDQFNTNFDLKVSESNRLSAKFFWANNPELQALYNSFGLGNALPVPGFGANTNFNQRVLSVDDIQIFSPSVVNDLRFGWTTITTVSTPQEPFTSAQLGIGSPLSNLFPGMPEISVANQFDLGASPFSDNNAKEPTYTAGDTLSWTKGRHALRFGAEYKHHELTETFNLYTRGQIFFLGYSGDPFKDFLGGYFDLTGLTIMGSGVNNRDILSYDLSGFMTDDWRVTDHFTINLGLRYEYFAPFTEAQGRYVGINPSLLKTAIIPGLPAGDNTAIVSEFLQASNATHPLANVPLTQSSIVPPDKNDFAPRFGFAWQPSNSAQSFVVRGGYGIYYDHPNSRFINNQILNFPYYTLAQAFFTPISNPFVQVPPPNAYPLQFNNAALFPFGGPPAFLPAASILGPVQPISANGIFPDIHDFRTPYVQQYSFGVQNEFAKDWMLDVSYVGSLGRKLLRLVDLNQEYGPSTPTAAPLSPGLSSLAVQGFGVHLMQSSSNSSYNALQASLTKRFSHGLQFLAAYTWSHSIDDYSGDPTGTSDVTVVPGNQVLLNNRASSDFDRRQRLVFSGFYEFPHFYKRAGFGSQVLNGWQLATILTIQSGTPFSVLTNATAFVQARADANPATPGCNATLSGSTISRLNEYFNLACFAPALAAGDFGNTGRNILVGPGQRNIDISVLKFFPVAEHSYFELRAEFFNAFNNVNFANPVNILASTNPGAIVATTTGPRVVQFAAKFNF
ncbi:MAG: carboxypeptidase regulatory-like domain-containing protein [Acidobacteriaceae bacterium]|nr:carboxypeptidase regulatory-like domain-containing protein [Acidobacteriaceae bacterium]